MTQEERLQEYLDGRMTAAARTAFEAELAQDPKLASAVRFAQGVGRALRADVAELSAEFHENARARFEQTLSATRPARRIPWEGIGLAIAAMLVLAIFLPWPRGGSPQPADPSYAAPSRDSEIAEAKHDAAVPQERREPKEVSVPLAPALGSAAVPATELAADPESKSILEPAKTTARATAPPRAIMQGFAARSVEVVEPPIQPGFSRVIETATDPLWVSILEGTSDARSLAPRFESERVFVAGPRERPFACRDIAWIEGGEEIVLFADAANTAPGLTFKGCAIVIPRGNLPVRFELQSGN